MVRLVTQVFSLHPSRSNGLFGRPRKAYFPRRPVLQMDMLPFFSVVECGHDDLR